MQGLIVASRGFSTSIVDTGLTSLEQVDATPQTGAKRGRGRPRKYPETSTPKPASDAPKRGRGRPRKIVSESEPAVVTPSGPKRGRGRPRKDLGMGNILTCCGWYILTLVPCYQAM
jgi:AT hook motif.